MSSLDVESSANRGKVEEQESLLKLWIQCAVDETKTSDLWQQLKGLCRDEKRKLDQDRVTGEMRWQLTEPADFRAWYAFGNGLQANPAEPGELKVDTTRGQPTLRILQAGVHTDTISTLHRGFLASPHFQLDREYDVWLRIRGGGKATVRYAVQNYPRNGTVYPIADIKQDEWYWQRFDVKYWNGDEVHLELATARDAPLQVGNEDRSWFGIREVVVRPTGSDPPVDDSLQFLTPLFATGDEAPRDLEQLADRYGQAAGGMLAGVAG